MRLLWLPESQQDIQHLYDFLVQKDPRAAARAMMAILEGAEHLLEMPERGRPMEDDTLRRELFVAFGAGAYVLRYRIDGNAVIIVRVWHSREHR